MSSDGETWNKNDAEVFHKLNTLDGLRDWFFDSYLRACASQMEVADLTSMIPQSYWTNTSPAEAAHISAVFGSSKPDKIRLEKLMFRFSRAFGALVVKLPAWADTRTSRELQKFLNELFVARTKLSQAHSREEMFEIVERMVDLSETFSSREPSKSWFSPPPGRSIATLLRWLVSIVASAAVARTWAHVQYMATQGAQLIADRPAEAYAQWRWYDHAATMFPEYCQPFLDLGLEVLSLNCLVRDKIMGGVTKSAFFISHLQYGLEKRDMFATDLLLKFTTTFFKTHASVPLQLGAGACALLFAVFILNRKRIAGIVELVGDQAFRHLCDLVDLIEGGRSMQNRLNERKQLIRKLPNNVRNVINRVR